MYASLLQSIIIETCTIFDNYIVTLLCVYNHPTDITEEVFLVKNKAARELHITMKPNTSPDIVKSQVWSRVST